MKSENFQLELSLLADKIREAVLSTKHSITSGKVVLYANGTGNNALHELASRIEQVLKDSCEESSDSVDEEAKNNAKIEFECQYCKRQCDSEGLRDAHESVCNLNPAIRNCETCKYGNINCGRQKQHVFAYFCKNWKKKG